MADASTESPDQTTENCSAWRVVTYVCPYLSHAVSEIWRGIVPYLPANIYLRHEAAHGHLEDSTVQRKAFRLLHLVRWLETVNRSFWEPDVRLGGDTGIGEFRSHLLNRTRPNGPDEKPELSRTTVNRIMGETLSFCRYWCGPSERIQGDVKSSRYRRGSDIRRPPLFRVRLRGRSQKGKESLHPSEITRITDHLDSLCSWGNLNPIWSPAERRSFKLAKAWAARNAMLWATYLSTGVRRGEVPALMEDDVVYDSDTGWWIHLVDPRDELQVDPRRNSIWERGAQLKSGSRDLIVWFQDIFGRAYKRWISWRPYLVANTGVPDHGALLVSGAGGGRVVGEGITYDSADRFFRVLNEELGPFHGDASRTFNLSAHRVRHSLESVMKALDVPIHVRQAVLGHQQPDTTELYGTVYRTTVTNARDQFLARWLEEQLE